MYLSLFYTYINFIKSQWQILFALFCKKWEEKVFFFCKNEKKFLFSKCRIRQHSVATLPLHSFQHQFLKLLHCLLLMLLLLLLLLRWQEEQGAWLLLCCWAAWTTRRWRTPRSTIQRIWQLLALDLNRVEWPTPDVWNARSRLPTRATIAPPETKKNQDDKAVVIVVIVICFCCCCFCCEGSDSNNRICLM